MLLVGGKLLPVGNVLAEVNLLRSPEDGDGLLIHAKQLLLGRLDREQSVARHYIYREESA